MASFFLPSSHCTFFSNSFQYYNFSVGLYTLSSCGFFFFFFFFGFVFKLEKPKQPACTWQLLVLTTHIFYDSSTGCYQETQVCVPGKTCLQFFCKKQKSTSACQEFPSEASTFSVSRVHPTFPVSFVQWNISRGIFFIPNFFI